MRYTRTGQMTFSDRVEIEIALCNSGTKISDIAKKLGRHPSTISREIKENRTFIQGTYPYRNDCIRSKTCTQQHVCGDEECRKKCVVCRIKDCHQYCCQYQQRYCSKLHKPPYVCNCCSRKPRCVNERYVYSAKHAQAAVDRRRSESRQHPHVQGEELQALDALVTKLVMQGQPLVHIYGAHKDEIPVSLRSLYTYVDRRNLTIRNLDLRRKTKYKPRKKGKSDLLPGFKNQEYRRGRTYDDYLDYMNDKQGEIVVEMDTVRGCREAGKRLLTMIFRRNSVMLLFLMPDGTADSVHRVFDYLEYGLGIDVFRRLFPVILTDNGSEFKRVNELEMNDDGEYRTSLYYCDPMASWQKGQLEKNHEYIRYVLPQGKSLSKYTQEDITKLMNHINSTRRPRLGNKCPYELVAEDDEDMKALLELLEMHFIPSDKVHLKPDLLKQTH